eukprot:404837_1
MTSFTENAPAVEAFTAYIHLLLVLFLLAICIPWYSLMKNLYFYKNCCNKISTTLNKSNDIALVNTSYHRLASSSTQTSTNDNSKSIFNLSPFLKIILTLSIWLSLLYNLDTTLRIPTYFTNHGMTILFCKINATSTVTFYPLARTLLYVFFVKRTQTLFEETIFKYNPLIINVLLTTAVIITILIISSTVIMLLCYTDYTIDHDANGTGQHCIMNIKYQLVIPIVWIIGSFLDIIFQFVSMYLLISKLFVVIHTQNKRKMLKVMRKQSDINDKIELELQYEPPIIPAKNSIFQITSKSISSRSNPNITSPKSRSITREDVDRFHLNTTQNNDLVMLISRLCILFFVIIASSQIMIILFTFIPSMVLIWYSCDSMINAYCLWLSFSISHQYYDKYFCGRKCLKCCFPVVKTASLIFYDDYKDEKNISVVSDKKSCNGCKLCCYFCCCRYCINYDKREEHLEIYTITCAEFDLILNKQ